MTATVDLSTATNAAFTARASLVQRELDLPHPFIVAVFNAYAQAREMARACRPAAKLARSRLTDLWTVTVHVRTWANPKPEPAPAEADLKEIMDVFKCSREGALKFVRYCHATEAQGIAEAATERES